MSSKPIFNILSQEPLPLRPLVDNPSLEKWINDLYAYLRRLHTRFTSDAIVETINDSVISIRGINWPLHCFKIIKLPIGTASQDFDLDTENDWRGRMVYSHIVEEGAGIAGNINSNYAIDNGDHGLTGGWIGSSIASDREINAITYGTNDYSMTIDSATGKLYGSLDSGTITFDDAFVWMEAWASEQRTSVDSTLS
jgi:hypothetical protein